jgi:histidinol-phosphate aminotransferase
VPVRLNVNENPYPPAPAVRQALTQSLEQACKQLNRYPDRDFPGLRQALAKYLAAESAAPWLTAANLWAANGSNEVMQQLFQAFGGPGRTALSFEPTYSMYPEYARNTNTAWVVGARRDDFSLDLPAALALLAKVRPSIVLLASPNNPTGGALSLAEIRAVAEATADYGQTNRSQQLEPTGGIVIVDEAYAEFRRPGQPSALSLLPDYPHLAVSRTMSKAFAMAGARLGYLAGQAELVNVLRTVRLPYHLSSLTQAAALAALGQADQLLAQVDQLRQTRQRVAQSLRSIINPATGQGLEVAQSDANFLLFGRLADRHAVWQGLLDRGVLIREVGPAGYLRVSMGTASEMDAFLEALAAVLTAHSTATAAAKRLP